MRNKIAFKLTLYFSIVLLVFSLIIGSVFRTLFKNHALEMHKEELQRRAISMSQTLSEFININRATKSMSQGGYGMYLRFLDEIAMADAWIVDENLELITAGHMKNEDYRYSDLPQNAEKVVKKVFEGKIAFSEGFSELLNKKALTIGVPIVVGEKIIAALLLHSPVQEMNQSITKGIDILGMSILVALSLTVILSIVLAITFTKPLKKMKNSAMRLAEGDYTAKTGVRQRDEIGELALVIDSLSQKLDLASKESEQLLKLRRDFIANISHELRTPVTVIRGSLEALCDEVVTDKTQVKLYHEQMLKETLFLQRLVNDLLDLSRLQNTDFKIEMQTINLCEVLNDVVRSTRHISQLKAVQISQEQDTNICEVEGDYGRLRQMFMIILDNAVKFSPKGGQVTVNLKDKTVLIKDKGVGIAQQDLPYIFDRFYKVKSEENKIGTGLGLAIVKQIADRHDIQVSVRSKEQEGTQFIFKF